jgi:flagellar hook protein FlgE
MNISMSNGLSGLQTHGAMVEVAGNNLANLNTDGFQSSGVAIGDNGTSGSDQVEIGRGAQVLAIQSNAAELTTGNDPTGTLNQSSLAGNNVDPAREMVNLILGQRGFEANLKAIRTANEMLGQAIDIKV